MVYNIRLSNISTNLDTGLLATTSTLYYSLTALAAGELHEIRGKHT
jgi:hypothetical protein